MSPLFVAFLLLRHRLIYSTKIQGIETYANNDEQPRVLVSLSCLESLCFSRHDKLRKQYEYNIDKHKHIQDPGQSFRFRSQPLAFSIPVCNVDCRTVKNQYSYCLKTNIFMKRGIIIFLMSVTLIQSFQFE